MAAGTDKSKVRVAVVGDASQLEKELRKAEAQLSGFGANAKKSGDILRTAVFGGAVLYGAKKLVDAAGDLQQSIGGTSAVFEDAAGSVSDFTKNAADLVGMSENAARTITSKLGASLKGFGMSTDEAAKQSINLTTIGADLAATLGGKTEDAVGALGSALRGEYDPLEAFGIALKASEVNAKAVSMGLASSESDVSAYAKGQATLALITERSAFAQGQFAREADTAQGQAQRAAAGVEDASAKLGKKLLPIYTDIQEGIGYVADAFNNLPDPVSTGLLALGGVALIAKPASDAFLFMNSAIRGIPGIFNGIADRAIASAGGLDAAAAKANLAVKNFAKFGLVTAGVFAVAEGFKAIAAATADFGSTDVERITASLKTFATENTGGVLAEDIGKLKDALKEVDRSSNVTNKLKLGFSQWVESGTTEKAKESVEAVDTALKSLFEQDPANAAKIYEQLLSELGISADKGRNYFDGYAGAVDDAQLATGALADPVNAATTALKDEGVEAEKATEKLKKLYEITNDLFGANVSLEEAEIDTRKALEDYNKSLSDGSLTADQRKQKELDLIKSFQDQAKAAVDAAAAQATFEGKTLTAGEQSAIQSQKLKELAGTLAPDSPLRKRIEELSLQLFFLSLQDPTVVIKLETEQAMAKFKAFLRDLGIPEGGQIGLGDILSYSQRASGGPVDAGTPYLVGEKGPELFVPSSYGRIIDAFSTSKAMLESVGGGMNASAGATYNINVNVAPTADKAAVGQSIVEAISSYERRSGAGWRG